MIERMKVEGRDATVAWLDREWNPVENKDDATMIKIIFDDGDIRFAVPSKANDADEADDQR